VVSASIRGRSGPSAEPINPLSVRFMLSSLDSIGTQRVKPILSPKTCGEHAEKCMRLAESLPEGRSRQLFAELAERWTKRAADLEKCQAVLDEAVAPAAPYRFSSRIGKNSAPTR
jgi:hypothetical protein